VTGCLEGRFTQRVNQPVRRSEAVHVIRRCPLTTAIFRPKKRPTTRAVHARRLGPGGQALPCRPYSYDTVRCFHTHAEDDPAIGQPITPKKLGQRAGENAAESARRKPNPGLEPKTVVNTHRMLHRAWEDFTSWGWAKRNVVSDAHPPRVPRKGRKVWTVAQLQTFLQHARSDRFFAL
jgi:hypothetical protein